MSRMPSLRALRAFQVAGTHLNLADAAEELFITPSGVSHQIRLLEDELDVRLFNRTGRGLELTERGQALLPLLSSIFEDLEDVITRFKADRRARPVNIAMPVTFASRWFIPNLGKFETLHPNVSIRLTCLEGNAAKVARDLDCVIHLGPAEWKGYRSIELFSEKLIAVCSPKLLRGESHYAPADVGHFRLLEVESEPGEWDLWARETGAKIPQNARTLTFDTRELALQGAFEGLGIALAGVAEVAEDSRRGRLVAAFESLQVVSGTYFLSILEPSASMSGVSELAAWVRSQFSNAGS